jgi:LPS-assembly protein
MLKSGSWSILSWFFFLVPLGAQDTQVLPDSGPPPAVDTITPVPPPSISFGSQGTMETALPKELKINNQGGTIEGNIESGVRLGGPVKIQGDNGLEIFSDTALLDLKAKTVTLIGGVTVYQGNIMQRGDRAVYYYERKFLDASGLRASMDPILLEAGKFTVEQRGDSKVFVGENAGITTHDVEDPNYWMRAQKTTIYPGDKIVFNQMKIYAGKTPVFWLPYLSQPLSGELGYHFIPGVRSSWGAYLLNSYGIMLGGKTDPVTGNNKDAWLLSRWRLDLLSSRGAGTGVDLVDTRVDNVDEISGLSLYYLKDFAPETSRSGVRRGVVDPDRYRIELKHRLKFDGPDDADWRFDSNLTLLSDSYFLEDFDRDDYRDNPAPDNTLGFYRRDDNSLLSLYTRFRLNDFYRADTRLPEISFDQARRPIFGLPLLHEGKTSLGFIGEQAADPTRNAILNPLLDDSLTPTEAQLLLRQLTGYERQLVEQYRATADIAKRDALRTQLLDANYGRFNTYQELSLPMLFGGGLSFTPEVGLGYSRYLAADGPLGDSDRTQLHVGVESSLKFSKDLGPYQNPDWGIDGLLHVFQPYANWSLISANNVDLGDPMVDRLTPSTRPRPLDPMRFTATDEMQNWNVLRFGARNRLLTKRDNQSFEWLYLDTYMDAFIDDPEGQRTFSNLYNDIRWQPLPWMGVDLETQFPIAAGGSGFNEFSSLVRFMPTDNFEFSLGYRWLSGHPVLTDSNRFVFQTYSRLSANWGIGTRHILELDDGTLETQQYTIHRDLGNWVAGMGVTSRDNRLQQEYGLMFSLTLKDFPSVSLPLNLDAQQ